jgi:putative aldouronate transport system permease protein
MANEGLTHRRPVRVFPIVNAAGMVLLCIIFLYPFIYALAVSLSDARAILSGEVLLYPVGFNTVAYQTLLLDAKILRAFGFTLWVTVLGVAISVSLTTALAYPLSRKGLRGGTAILFLLVFTMYFSGGLIPYYILMKKLTLLNKIWVLVLPGVDTFLLIVMVSYLRGIPVELLDAAAVEGAGNISILMRVVLPLSVPILATLAVFYSVGLWNTFSRAVFFISDSRKYTLQVILYEMLNVTDVKVNQSVSVDLHQRVLPENLKAAAVMITVGPIIFVYPFLQKYFIKGITVGSLKG